ncbi:hypothetical protein JW960_19510 [candidate division KSB1 bacterium]|nr:hypothetical protein [candidate division KSB1 bacterium]
MPQADAPMEHSVNDSQYPELAVSQRRAAAVRGTNGVEGYTHFHLLNGYEI